METLKQTFEWWGTNKAVLANCLLFFSAIITWYFPLLAQRRLPALTRDELTAQCPNLRWLRWGSFVWLVGTLLVTVPIWVYVMKRLHRLPDDNQSGFLVAAVLCLPPLSAGVFALWTGVYRGLGRRGFTDKYYRVAGSQLSWIPLSQIIAALTIAAVSLAGFFTMAPH
jgi:hypothetical protein